MNLFLWSDGDHIYMSDRASRDAQFEIEIGIEFGSSFGMIKQLACWLAVLSLK